jgi:excisionase family DNA binding protein
MKNSAAASAPVVAPLELAELPQLAGVGPLSRRLGIEEPTLRAWARDGTIPAFRIQKLWMFDVAEVAAWLATKRSGRS